MKLSKKQSGILNILTEWADMVSQTTFSIKIVKNTEGNVSPTWYTLEGVYCFNEKEEADFPIEDPVEDWSAAWEKVTQDVNKSDLPCPLKISMENLQVVGRVLMNNFCYPNKGERGVFAHRLLKNFPEGSSLVITFDTFGHWFMDVEEKDEYGESYASRFSI